MRRLIATLSLTVLCVGLFPARADAYFWKWIDDLSGPRFSGFLLDWRVWCRSENVRSNRGVIESLQGSLRGAIAKYTAAENGASARDRAYFGAAREAAQAALELATKAVDDVDNPDRDVSDLVLESLRLRELAEVLFRSDALGPPPPPLVKKQIEAKTRTGGGVTLSICDAKAFERRTVFVNLNAAWGYDKKKGRVEDHNRMVRFGATYHAVVLPYLVVGSGAGVAWFSSDSLDGFQKFYLEPYIVDFRPFAMRRNSELRGPWWHVLYFRYSTLMFPAGFEPGRFRGPSPRFNAELVHSVGVHADLEPVMRKLRGKW